MKSTRAILVYILAILAAVVVTGDWLFQGYDRYVLMPITQAAGFFTAFMVGWFGWERHLSDRRVNTVGAVLSAVAIVFLIAMVRIAYRLG